MLECCLHLRLDDCLVSFGHAGAVVLPSNMVDAKPYQSVSSFAGGCYESSCDTLPQPLILTGFWQGVAAQHPLEVVHHPVVDVYNLSMVFGEAARDAMIMSLRTISCVPLIFKDTPASIAFLSCSIVW
jgi:hypothetical protein